MIEASDLITELFITSVAMLESDYDSAFVIAMKLWAMVVEIGASTDLLQSHAEWREKSRSMSISILAVWHVA